MSQTSIQIAFAELKVRLLRITRRFLSSEEDAEDAVQETFCRLWQIRDHLKSHQEATAMAITTARNICIDQLRRSQVVEFNRLESWSESIGESRLEREIEARDEFRLVQLLIEQRLSPLQQQVLRMREVDEMEFREIAEALEMEEPAVRMTLSRAKRLIKELYRQLNP